MKATELRLDDVLVLSADAEELSGRQRRLALDVLSAGDRDRLREMRDARADAFLAGRLLIQMGLASLAPRLDLPTSALGMASSLRDGLQPIPKRETHLETEKRARARMQAVALEVVCSRCGSSDHGKPSLPGMPVLVSIAYAGPVVFVALASMESCSALGIDAEALGHDGEALGFDSPGFGSSPSSSSSPRPGPGAEPEPAADLEHWTAVEAVLKADGRGLRIDPSEVVFDGDALARVGDDDAAYRIHRTVVDDRFLLAVVTRRTGCCDVQGRCFGDTALSC